jgi:hypothetical protein
VRAALPSFPIANDIRFWIAFFFVIRLIGITNPPLEVGHNWRQTTVTMVARNFQEVDNNILYPRIDFAGEKTGITGMEFPVLNYLIYGASEIFGYAHWYGRLINLIVSSFGLWFFFRLLSIFFKAPIAFYSTLILSVSIWFQFSRKIMPDTFAMSLIMAGMYYGVKFLKDDETKKNWTSLLLYFILIMFGVLAKLPTGYLLVVFIVLFFDKKILLQRKIILSLITTLALIPSVLWYFYWVPFLVDTYGFWHFFMGKSMRTGFAEILNHAQATFQKFYDTALKFIGFALFIWGFVQALISRDKKLLWTFFATFFLFSIIIFKAGYTFPHHNYYIIPFVPVMALIAGYGLTAIASQRWRLVIIIAIAIEGIANQQHDFFLKDKQKKLLSLEADLASISQPGDLIAINSGDFPTPMYFAHRKGWILKNEDLSNETYLEDLKRKGLKFIVVLHNNNTNHEFNRNFKILLVADAYSIYQF